LRNHKLEIRVGFQEVPRALPQGVRRVHRLGYSQEQLFEALAKVLGAAIKINNITPRQIHASRSIA
jgi:hypothetical protein